MGNSGFRLPTPKNHVVRAPRQASTCPWVDALFRSAARYGGKNCIGVIMTGMGDDGVRGMKEMKDAGAVNIAQDETTCVVYGMPKEAVKAGGVDYSLPLGNIAPKVLQLSR